MTLIVSLTTIPGRVDCIQRTINSITEQTLKPDYIFLALPERCRRQPRKSYCIPKDILKLNKLIILREEYDYGPSMKLLPALKQIKDPEAKIVTVDDDHIYYKQFLETIAAFSEKYPECALGFNGWNVRPLIKRNRYEFIDKQLPEPVQADVLEGYRGVLYKKKFFTEDIFNYAGFPRIAYKVDDVWISAHLAMNGIQRLVLPGAYCKEEESPGGLHKRWTFKAINRRMARVFHRRGIW
jgi:hypothetical protein